MAEAAARELFRAEGELLAQVEALRLDLLPEEPSLRVGVGIFGAVSLGAHLAAVRELVALVDVFRKLLTHKERCNDIGACGNWGCDGPPLDKVWMARCPVPECDVRAGLACKLCIDNDNVKMCCAKHNVCVRLDRIKCDVCGFADAYKSATLACTALCGKMMNVCGMCNGNNQFMCLECRLVPWVPLPEPECK
jgi:hypothetical protein